MIGEAELAVAIDTAQAAVGLGDRLALSSAGIEPEPVLAYARRFAQVSEAGEKPYPNAAAGGFTLGFRLGVLAARLERRED